jgi:branched-subunit amino acid aminotransferase/4-amino-4-deoxychorismate lyase
LVARRGKGNVVSMKTLAFAPWLGVFETLRVIDGVPLFVREHRAELRRSATALGLNIQIDFEKACAELPEKSGRWRWIMRGEETAMIFTEEPPAVVRPIALSISTVRVGSQNWDARFKTVSYLAHIQALRSSSTPEAVLLNEHGEVASAASANIFWRRGSHLYTPAHEAGCRCGIVRGFVLAHEEAEEGHFSLDELIGADEIFLTNSLRGVISINALEGQARTDFSRADELRLEYEQAVNAMLAQR